MPTAVFRTDAGVAIGGGHVMRCLTLANELYEKKWECSFVCSEAALTTVPELAKSKHKIIILGDNEINNPLPIKENWSTGVELFVVDNYQLNADYESAFRPWAARILVIDDLANRAHDADILLD